MSAVVLAVVLSLGASASFAVDGVLEINQASVLAGGGFPLSISQAGSYRLTSNLVVPSGSDGITATVDGVRLDLNGFSVTGPGSCSPNIDGNGKLTSVTCSGLVGTGVEGVAALENGTITGFATGIQDVAGRALALDRMVVTENGTGLDAGSSGAVRIADSRFSVHSGDGADTFGNVGSTLVVGSTFERNGGQGLYLSAGLVSQSSFHQNKLEGIRANSGRGATVESCYFEDNQYGIFGNGVGYRGNVFVDNTTNVGGVTAVQLGDNLCDGALCP